MERNGLSHQEAGKLGSEKSKIAINIRRIAAIAKYEEDPSICVQCEKILPYDKKYNKFCCTSCSATYNNTLYPKRHVVQGKIKACCLWCGEQVRGSFCNCKCQALYNTHIKINTWLLTHVCYEGAPYIKEWILQEQRNVCNHCGITPIWNNKRLGFELEHIDGNSNNNRRDNLEVLCPNCHSQTPTYKARNKGNGRHKRRERYKEGQSF